MDIPDIQASLGHLIGQIPRGRVTTYGDLATALGAPVAARWVGHYALHHAHTRSCVCHRIVRADGHPGRYVDGSSEAKAARLAAEGVAIVDQRVPLARYRFRPFVTDGPLAVLRRQQEAIVGQVRLTPPAGSWRFVAGVDVSYPTAHSGVAAYVLIDLANGRPIWSTTVAGPVRFPYISSFLSFRELPLLMLLLARVTTAGRLADVILVDGSGILHPRGAGIATHLGVTAAIPTIGVTKKPLFGTVSCRDLAPGQSCTVTDAGRVIGVALRCPSASRRPIYVSPGHLIDVSRAETVVRQVLAGHRLPEPLYWADRISRQAARDTAPR